MLFLYALKFLVFKKICTQTHFTYTHTYIPKALLSHKINKHYVGV